MYLIFIFAVYFYVAGGSDGVRITSVSVPEALENDSETSGELRCEWRLSPGEQILSVRWWLDGAGPVYEWSPGTPPRVSGPLVAARLDRRRPAAVLLPRPSVDMAGEYECHVVADGSEDRSAATLTVFAGEERMTMRVQRGGAEVSCGAYGAYPRPELAVFAGEDGRRSLGVVRWTGERRTADGRFDAGIVAAAAGELIAGDAVHCELRLPRTGYVRRKSLVYWPDAAAAAAPTAVAGSLLSLLNASAVLALWILLFM